MIVGLQKTNSRLAEENVASTKKITDLTVKLNKKDSEMLEHKKTAIKKTVDFELEIDQLYLKIESMEQHNLNDNIIWRQMNTENLKLNEVAKVSKYMLEQQQDLMKVLISRKSLDSCPVSTQTITVKTEMSDSPSGEATDNMLKIVKEQNSYLSVMNRDSIVLTVGFV